MKAHQKTKVELLIESNKEIKLARLFNECLRLMDAAYLKYHQVQ